MGWKYGSILSYLLNQAQPWGFGRTEQEKEGTPLSLWEGE